MNVSAKMKQRISAEVCEARHTKKVKAKPARELTPFNRFSPVRDKPTPVSTPPKDKTDVEGARPEPVKAVIPVRVCPSLVMLA